MISDDVLLVDAALQLTGRRNSAIWIMIGLHQLSKLSREYINSQWNQKSQWTKSTFTVGDLRKLAIEDQFLRGDLKKTNNCGIKTMKFYDQLMQLERKI